MLVWMMILRNQRPRYIRGLGLVDCSIETFVAVRLDTEIRSTFAIMLDFLLGFEYDWFGSGAIAECGLNGCCGYEY